MRERWGVFSVRDHMGRAPFVTEVLLYDRVVVPVPPPNAAREDFWNEYDTDLQARCLDILGRKTEQKDGLALTVPWDQSKRERFKSAMSTAAALATQKRTPEQPYYVDPFEMTRQLIKDEFRPALPSGVRKAWAVAAFPSVAAYDVAMKENERDARRRQLAATISHRFLTPQKADPRQEMLRRAVDLSNDDKFRKKREELYAWQESVLEDNLSSEKAVKELEGRLAKYNDAVAKAFKDVQYRFLYMIVPLGIGLANAIATGSHNATLIAGAVGLVQIARFVKFDRHPNVDAGDLDDAAMIHDARKRVLNS